MPVGTDSEVNVLIDSLIRDFFFISGHTQRLTYARKGGRGLADDPLVAGIPSYVMQEEFNRYQGYWWQPYSSGL